VPSSGENDDHGGRAARGKGGHDHALGLVVLSETVDFRAVETTTHFEYILILGDKLRVKSILGE
jgi:hypothetical protein